MLSAGRLDLHAGKATRRIGGLKVPRIYCIVARDPDGRRELPCGTALGQVRIDQRLTVASDPFRGAAGLRELLEACLPASRYAQKPAHRLRITLSGLGEIIGEMRLQKWIVYWMGGRRDRDRLGKSLTAHARHAAALRRAQARMKRSVIRVGRRDHKQADGPWPGRTFKPHERQIAIRTIVESVGRVFRIADKLSVQV